MGSPKKASKKSASKPAAKELDAGGEYKRFLPDAKALSKSAVLPYRLDPDIAIANVRTAMKVFDAHRDEIPKHLPKIDRKALEALPALALATKRAAMMAEESAPSEKIVSQKLDEARQLRTTLLPVVAGLASTGLVPRQTYVDIIKGRGARDIAGDCVAIADVFRNHKDAIHGKHSADPAMIEKAAVVGSWLLQELRAPGAKTPKAPPPSPAVDTRNRLATLLVERYETLQTVAHYFEGADYERAAPPLMSRQATKKSAKKTNGEAGESAGDTPAPTDV
jgi:hypothetical protein